ncbi:Adaptive-response sensory-kinase SasA [subsurface metagenome]
MKVRTSLFLLSAILAILVVALGFTVLYTSDLTNREVRESDAASKIIKDISELNIVTYEYLMHYEERMHQQWLLKYDSLGRLLEGMRSEEMYPEHLSKLESITSDYESLGDFFSQLQANFVKRQRLIEENKPQAEIDLSLALEKRLTAQALMRSQRIASEAFECSAITQQRIARLQQRTNSIVLFSVIGFAILSFCVSFLTTRAITGPLNKLVRSAEIIGEGNLKHRVNIKTRNEISELAVAFNQMTEKRQRAEDKLKEYSENLEEIVEERTQKLREAQEQLVRKEKLAILGQLAGGVGHELRNPLGSIKNAAYFLKMALEQPEPEVKETLEILNKEVATSEHIISSLLDFARPKPPTRHKVEINHLLQEVLSRTNVPEKIKVVSKLDESLSQILADPEQLGQVFRNLILNAIQAMPDGGQLEIRSEVSPPAQLAISFADTGVGIPEDNLKKLFEPLFTTRAKGIGLGLAITKTLVEGHKGTIEVQSKLGKGSIFTVRLPIREKEED